MSPALINIRQRAHLLKEARAFFSSRNVLEVDPCALSPYAPIDSNIDVISAQVSDTEKGFLHTSPEYAMKRLLALGSGDIYFLGHVFRKNERGRLHNPEFTMAEWYRLHFTLLQMIEETAAFLSLFLGSLPVRILSYRAAFSQVGINYTEDPLLKLQELTGRDWPRETCLHFLLTHLIEPELGQNELTVLTDYPPHEAALASVTEKNGELVANRFEIYYQGVELSNGYHELCNASELRRRFHKENNIRKSANKETYALDERFLSAMQKGMPDCCGVSVGVDRALMLRQKCKSIGEVLPFCWGK
ncbi:MAG: EF-P lysine aminoacylase GenX [Chlamydiae bacterium RIFCSPHIGHO2_12_FULL_49_9]|nr:MAG: EF-P lysine aminoacylase GenX [Chlamydiae bacterium RIFCSPHIGHO2_12_FULL_49_9]